MADYASRLSEYKNKGECGLPENLDSQRVLKMKLKKLYDLVSESKHIVVLTGAGISTTAGIPDFRGPKGVWTMEKKVKKMRGKKRKKESHDNQSIAIANVHDASVEACQQQTPSRNSDNNGDEDCTKVEGGNNLHFDHNEIQRLPLANGMNGIPAQHDPQMTSAFESAEPTYTHRAITHLMEKGIFEYCITQNVDGLHRRTGLDRSKLAILHGCVFTEKCEKCDKEYFRDYDIGGMSFQATGRFCDPPCEGALRDIVLDWEDELPEKEFEEASRHCEVSDLVICLGTSLRIEPAGSLPCLSKRYVIVNLQVTPKDDKASLIIRAKVDDVMKDLMNKLELSLDK